MPSSAAAMPSAPCGGTAPGATGPARLRACADHAAGARSAASIASRLGSVDGCAAAAVGGSEAEVVGRDQRRRWPAGPARCITFFSSRTLPGQSWRQQRRARRVAPARSPRRPRKCSASGRMSSRPLGERRQRAARSRSAGSTGPRGSVPARIMAGRSALVALMHAHVDARACALEPRRSNRPVSSTRSSFIWPASDRLPISSRNSVPPSAASKRPSRARVAPV